MYMDVNGKQVELLNKRVAFVMHEGFLMKNSLNRKKVSEQDRIRKYLENKEVVVDYVYWNDKDVDWNSYDLINLSNIADYMDDINGFSQWLDKLAESKAKLHNNASLVKWNSTKSFMIDLQNEGINIVPTISISKNSNVDLQKIMQEQGWNKCVVKGDVAMCGQYNFKVDYENSSKKQKECNKLLQDMGILIQKFMPEIKSGETSYLIYGDGAQLFFSHAVKKTPKKDEYKCHVMHGGSVANYQPSLEEVKRVFSDVLKVKQTSGLNNDMPLLIRADYIGDYLIEFELGDPTLFLEHSANPDRAAQIYANCILTRVGLSNKLYPIDGTITSNNIEQLIKSKDNSASSMRPILNFLYTEQDYQKDIKSTINKSQQLHLLASSSVKSLITFFCDFNRKTNVTNDVLGDEQYVHNDLKRR